MTLAEIQKKHYEIMERNGFHEDYRVDNKLLLVHTEVSEAAEELRDGQPTDLIYGVQRVVHEPTTGWIPTGFVKPEGFPVELADVILRVLDICEHEGIDMQAVLELKLAYNETRPFKHGRKF